MFLLICAANNLNSAKSHSNNEWRRKTHLQLLMSTKFKSRLAIPKWRLATVWFRWILILLLWVVLYAAMTSGIHLKRIMITIIAIDSLLDTEQSRQYRYIATHTCDDVHQILSIINHGIHEYTREVQLKRTSDTIL